MASTRNINSRGNYKMENDEYIIDDRKIPNDVIIIYDEVHKCKNITTNNGRIPIM